MAQYIPFDQNVEVNGQTILSFVNAMPTFRTAMLSTLATHGLVAIEPELWYAQKSWLNAFKEIGEKHGANTLFNIGKAIPENAIFPPNISDLHSALSSINVAYHLNHRNGEIGYYQLLSFDEQHKVAVMECKNPYPSHFDRGIITTMAKKFKPAQNFAVNVILDDNLPSRLNGAESCTYRIAW
jgi:hypothetical protein